MRSPARVVLVVALASLVAAAAVPAGAAQQQPSPESMRMTVQLQSDGDARWTVSTRFVLENENETDAFRQLADEFVAGDAGVGYSLSTFEHAAAAAENATGRRMAIENPERTRTLNTTGNVSNGTLRLSFTWTNFARQEGDELVVGGAFNTTDGTWLPALTADQSLVVRPPPGYGPLTFPTGAENGVFRWTGPREFEPGYLYIVYEQGAGPTDSPTPPGPGPDLSWLLWAGLFAIGVGVLALAVYLWSRREGGEGEQSPGGGDEPPTEPPGEPTDGGVAAAEDEERTEDAGVDPELLSDEERVLRMLDENGGRMKQADIVKETGWSNAKVSQLLSSMADDGQVEKLRIGRENLISLPGENVADVGSEGE